MGLKRKNWLPLGDLGEPKMDKHKQRLPLGSIAVFLFGFPTLAIAHGGGLNKEGCHNNRKTGDYHCHGGGSNPRATPTASYLSQPARSTLSRSDSSRAFANCSEARAAGSAPVRRGDAGYGSHLDRDNDGVGCE